MDDPVIGSRLPPEQRRQQLLEVTSTYVSQHGIEFSLDRIAAAAQVSPPLMRHYFKNRDGLLTALFERDVLATLGIFEDSARGSFNEYFDRYLDFVGARPWAHRLWMVALSQETVLTPRVMAARSRLMETTMMKPLADQSPEERVRASAWVGAVESCVSLWLADDAMSKAELLGFLTDLATRWRIPSALMGLTAQ